MAATLTLGENAPDFTLPRDGGGSLSLADFRGRNLVIYFFPRADTPGCTRESIAFSALQPEFAGANTAVIGVSADPVRRQDSFKAKHNLSVALASDETRGMIEAYGAWDRKSLYGRIFMGIIRMTVLIDDAGRVARIWPKVKVAGHAEEVLSAARALEPAGPVFPNN
jgi:peroxiredoxin Q/BCP